MSLPRRRIGLGLSIVLLGSGLTACTTVPASGPMTGGSGHRMMGGGSGYRSSARSCRPPADLPGTRVSVLLGDAGMSRMTGGVAPTGAHMMLHAWPGRVPAGDVSLAVANRGWRTHELVVLPLAPGAPAGRRPVGPDGRVSEQGSLGEASRSCGADGGEGIRAGSAGWTTIRLRAGRYELVCNLRHHYADGMHQALVVS
jgi:uncharacterized cupredoxin-like copper-binding protein